MGGDSKDTLLALYSEERSMVRHHEAQRTIVSSVLIGIEGVAAGALVFGQSTPNAIVFVSVVWILSGATGFLISQKLAERTRYHSRRGAFLLKAIEGEPSKTISSIFHDAKRFHRTHDLLTDPPDDDGGPALPKPHFLETYRLPWVWNTVHLGPVVAGSVGLIGALYQLFW